MICFIGIDQSINSTGVTIELYNNIDIIDKHFYIITGKQKLSSKEQKANDSYNSFDYILYNKIDIKSASNNHEAELFKTYNLINISRTIISIIDYYIKNNCIETIYICMEGVSYQSANTSSIIDLAGLNYIIRADVCRYLNKKEIKYNLIISPPSEIKKFASGNGAAKKEIMIKLFETIHPNLYLIPKIDDIADSYWMAEYSKNIYLYETAHTEYSET